LKRFPELKVVLEHITTKEAVDFVTDASQDIAATITAHHLLANRNHMFLGGIKPHYYCLPGSLKEGRHTKSP
jgi:dihydroorotase